MYGQSLCKFEYKGMKTVCVTYYTNQTPLRISDGKNLSQATVKNDKIFIKCAQNNRCTSSMYEQS